MASLSLSPQACPEASRRPGLSLTRLLVLLFLAVVIAGCVPRSRPAPPPEPEGPTEQPDGPSRLPPDETRNRVAVLVPLSGPNAGLGQSILNAANLALLDTGGQRIRITAYDTARGAEAAANEAIGDGSGLFLGPLLAEDVRAVTAIAARERVPVLAFSNDVSIASDGVYVLGFNPGQSVERVVAFARSRGAQRFAALVPTGVYGQRTGQALVRAVESAGGTLVGMESYERGATSLRTAANRLTARGRADAVLIADGSQVALAAIPIVRQSSPQPRILGTELWATDTNLGSQAALRGSWFAAPSDGNFAAFSRRYRARYNTSPFRLASLGYDAVLLTVRIAESWPIGRRFPARALRESTGFAGVDGAFRFGRDNVAERSLEIREVGAGTANVVSPAPRGFE
jgi:ABC-type branched-subunit amino acid transport system substrate-binding protein